MKRDMDLIRKILLAIEDQFVDVVLYNLEIEGYDLKTVAYHCKILNDAGLVSDYGSQYGDGELLSFGVSSLTWEGHEFLDKIRDNNVWNKTKEVMTEKGIPFVLDAVKQIASSIVSAMVEGAIKGIK
ncbi:DUF2513 domain-containing protein [Dehalobacter sp. TeCB1]|jgi:hypothetical protein|uniref:DUF2513 domain-containing protein n=1 Tax=Dehalobacter sp. TeCB1 TaxID=1843715 RepID=UPI00083B9AFC|nr:DUF2513 domain-containing protein [Dehalobacter sp. TeCB1]OCZ52204.1 hypothetical protein A7D23_11370 [Dehalobacter sp. TeCB1]